MRRVVADALHRVAEVIGGNSERPLQHTTFTHGQPRKLYDTPGESLFDADEGMAGQRNEDALGLMDENVHGYFMVTIRRSEDTSRFISLNIAWPEGAWPSLMETLERSVREVRRVC